MLISTKLIGDDECGNKGKEKRALQEKIDAQKIEEYSLNRQVQQEKTARENEFNPQIEAAQDELKGIREEYERLDRNIRKLNNELTQPR